MLSDEIHDVRRILQDQTAKLAVIEHDYRRLQMEHLGQSEHIKILEKMLDTYYRRGLFEGMSIAEFTAELNSDDPLGSIQTVIDGLREKGEFTMNDIVPTLRSLASAVQEQRDAEAKWVNEIESEERCKGEAEEPKPQYSITGKPLEPEVKQDSF